MGPLKPFVAITILVDYPFIGWIRVCCYVGRHCGCCGCYGILQFLEFVLKSKSVTIELVLFFHEQLVGLICGTEGTGVATVVSLDNWCNWSPISCLW